MQVFGQIFACSKDTHSQEVNLPAAKLTNMPSSGTPHRAHNQTCVLQQHGEG